MAATLVASPQAISSPVSAGGVTPASGVSGKGGVNWAFFFSHVRCV